MTEWGKAGAWDTEMRPLFLGEVLVLVGEGQGAEPSILGGDHRHMGSILLTPAHAGSQAPGA